MDIETTDLGKGIYRSIENESPFFKKKKKKIGKSQFFAIFYYFMAGTSEFRLTACESNDKGKAFISVASV